MPSRAEKQQTILNDPHLSPSAEEIMLFLLDAARPALTITLPALGTRLGYSERTAQRAANTLRDLGYIKVTNLGGRLGSRIEVTM